MGAKGGGAKKKGKRFFGIFGGLAFSGFLSGFNFLKKRGLGPLWKKRLNSLLGFGGPAHLKKKKFFFYLFFFQGMRPTKFFLLFFGPEFIFVISQNWPGACLGDTGKTPRDFIFFLKKNPVGEGGGETPKPFWEKNFLIFIRGPKKKNNT